MGHRSFHVSAPIFCQLFITIFRGGEQGGELPVLVVNTVPRRLAFGDGNPSGWLHRQTFAVSVRTDRPVPPCVQARFQAWPRGQSQGIAAFGVTSRP